MPNPHSLTIVVVAKNEERNIAECIASASFADEVLVLDSRSTDTTAAPGARGGRRVIQTDWPGYGPQVARGFSLATSDWVLSLDADERISPALRAEIQQAIRSGAHDGYRLPRLSEFCGKFIHHGGWRPDCTLRLGRRARASPITSFMRT